MIKNDVKMLLALYVDDGIIASSSEEEVQKLITDLQTEFKIKHKAADYFLGLEIQENKEGIKVTQVAYTRKLLEKFNMYECKPVSSPILKDENPQSRKAPDSVNENKKFPYREAVGSLMYLMTGTRPDIAYAVGVVSRNLDNYSESDVIKVKRIFRYLKGTCDLGITYKRNFKQGSS